ncbi:MAG: hypothetical protein JNJ77_15470 [Planctomycetia bacterium]|nr:hypothetical protein [Planctomycetia bacterium]
MRKDPFEILEQAVQNRKSVEIINHGKKQTTRRTICPHILGTKQNGTMQVLGYHLSGESSTKETIDPNDVRLAFRLMNIENIEIVQANDGRLFLDEWKTVPGYLAYWSPSFETVHAFVPDD